MTWRVDSSSLIAGKWVVSAYAGFGVRGADVPSGGTSGPSCIYPSLNLPADNDKEYRAQIDTLPSAGTLTLNEDGTITFTDAPDGTYYLIVRLFEYDPATAAVTDKGLVTVTLQVGVVHVTKDIAQGFAVTNKVTVDVVQGFGVTNKVTADVVQGFAVTNKVTKDIAQGFGLTNKVIADVVQGFGVVNKVTVDVVQGFGLTNKVTTDIVQGFAVTNKVTADIVQGFGVVNKVTLDIVQDFSIEQAGRVTKDISQSFGVQNAVTKDIDQGFAVRNAVAADVSQDFAVLSGVVIDIGQDFGVINQVTKDILQGFGVRNAVAKDIPQGFRVSAGGGDCPTAEENALAALAAEIEGGLSMRDVLRILLAANSGRTGGAGTITETFKSVDGTKDRITTDFDNNGNRIAVALDAS